MPFDEGIKHGYVFAMFVLFIILPLICAWLTTVRDGAVFLPNAGNMGLVTISITTKQTLMKWIP